MNTRKILRPADITMSDAKAQIAEAGMELVSLRLVDASGRKVASADAVGRSDLSWEATIKVAEFPFEKDEPKDERGSDSEFPVGGDDADEGDAPDLDDGDEESEEHKDEGEDKQILDLLKQIAEHMGIHPRGEEDPDEAEGLDLPDVGAPEPGDEAIPLPEPVEKKAPGAMGGTFASHIVVANADAMRGRRSFVAVVADAHLMNDGEIVNEARVAFPGYRVAGKIDRVTLADQREARVPLVAETKQG